MWPFRKHIDPTSVRLSAHASDIAVLYQRLYQLEGYIAKQILVRMDRLDKRVTDLEKILKSCNITITVVEKK